MDKDHKSLIYDLIKGDTNAFNYFYRIYYARMFNFANSYLRDDFVAGNIVQDTFMGLWENREKIEPEINLPAYLLTIVKNKALNHLHRLSIGAKVKEKIQSQAERELELRCATLMALDPEQMFHSDVQRIIHETLSSLPNQCRNVITLSRLDGLSNKEIASRLNISVKAVEFHITRALKSLRESLKDYLLFIVMMFTMLR
ncbi:MAG TPA: RNA polymerase sigma-70 factor [Bacteroidales bacterium]